ncbi:hypothetical protein T07_925 [Trichinella nelsoni]|uniref:Uncharacterized protein n=1 Tax=Trichinella nelsoni TaxID=6336 RepID=A0A0V0RQ33_9BILA|nr:hypothetical protein T07_925 [Trichinella nelsoni]
MHICKALHSRLIWNCKGYKQVIANGCAVCKWSMGKNYLGQNPHRDAFLPNNLSKLSGGN